MPLEHRLRKLEERRAVIVNAAAREKRMAQDRWMLAAMAKDPAAMRALREIGEAQVEYGHHDPRTRVLMKQHWPAIKAAMARYEGKRDG
jgi:hypothetical protein